MENLVKGNTIRYKGENVTVHITWGLRSEGFCGALNDGSDWLIIIDCNNKRQHMKPLEITPEILEKAGFKKLPFGSNPYLMFDGGEIVYDFDDSVLLIWSGTGDHESYGFSVEVKEFHKLQNIVYALTNQMLKLES